MLDQQMQHDEEAWKAELERLGPQRVRMLLSRSSTSMGEVRLFSNSQKINPNRADVEVWLTEKDAVQESATQQLADRRHQETTELAQKAIWIAVIALIVSIILPIITLIADKEWPVK
jgi:hypothetical protein